MKRIHIMMSALLGPWALMAISLMGIFVLFWAENQASSVPFTASIVFCIAAVCYAASRRIGFSIYMGWFMIGIIAIISLIKFKMKGFDLHFYDIYFLSNDIEVMNFLYKSYGYIILPVLLVIGISILLLIFVYKSERPSNTTIFKRVLVAGCSMALVPIMYPSEAASHPYFYYLGGHHASSFFVSLRDIENVANDTHALARLATLPAQPRLDTAPICQSGQKQPDVFVVLQESRLNPDDFETTRTALARLNHRPGGDVAIEPLQVETFGGGTWISNLSLMTGLSATDFGWRSPYLTISLQDKIKGGLPEIMARCGYRTMAILPMRYSFVNEGPFLKSIGFETVIDSHEMGSGNDWRRDNFYFTYAEEQIAKHRNEDGRPLFLLVQTMANHSPYRTRLEPKLALHNEPLHRDGETAEYFRRLLISHDDFTVFLEKRRAQQKSNPSVLLEFGDHHASVMKPEIEAAAGPQAFSDLTSLAYRTYFALHGFGHQIDRSAEMTRPLDIGFLSTVLTERARLPSSAALRDLGQLREICKGLFHACPARQNVDLHLKRRADSGLLDLFNRVAGPAQMEQFPAWALRR